ncbi:regulatory protein [Nocardioides daedukensis]|uniref:Regulatory protein RecX n=1 Tax=Nocardioides daedukensis TaxID=634462 RepID=A0A7Y9RXR4_9ACTN|nr:regulatory protein RecX [Nocardioides daedukensis]NYG57346.1 regulatory protein [Nocardioides daedukensis]
MSSSTPEWQGDVSAGVDAWVASAPDWVVDAVRESTGGDVGSSAELDHQAAGAQTFGAQTSGNRTFGTQAPDDAGAEDSSSRSGRRSARGTRSARGARGARGSGGAWGEGGRSGNRRRGSGRTQEPPEDRDLGPEPDHEAVARKILLDQLTGQARSRAELATKLAKKDVPEDIATTLLDRFEEVGLIDDEAFARAWIASRQPGKGLARRALAQELRRKGIDDEVARDALDEIDPDDEESAARLLVRKKLRTMRALEPNVATRRLVGMLARKGYPPGLAFRVVREELNADPDDPDTGGVDQVAGDW